MAGLRAMDEDGPEQARGLASGLASGPARALGRAAIAWLEADAERLGRFATLTGLTPADLARAPAEPGVLAGVLRQLVQDEPSLLAFTAEAGLEPERVTQAVQALDRLHWAREVP